MSETVIEVNNVSMRFNLAEQKTDSIKEYFLKLMKGELHFSEFYALNKVSFKVEKGDAVALVGMNGSGKSTMLKIISGILKPTSGEVRVDGSIAPLIELGAGFDQELTARENVYLNGAVLGHSRSFMDEHMDEIIEFSELHKFMDVPLKNFSSGMKGRLGFSIATIVSADILAVDEILAVGDFKFQEKCKDRMRELMGHGATVLFVSHNNGAVKAICNKAVWLDHGRVVDVGSAEDICEKYEESMQNS